MFRESTSGSQKLFLTIIRFNTISLFNLHQPSCFTHNIQGKWLRFASPLYELVELELPPDLSTFYFFPCRLGVITGVRMLVAQSRNTWKELPMIHSSLLQHMKENMIMTCPCPGLWAKVQLGKILLCWKLMMTQRRNQQRTSLLILKWSFILMQTEKF